MCGRIADEWLTNMRKLLKRAVSLVMASVMVCSLVITAFAAERENMSIGHYEYPIKPGTTEWEELGTFSRRIAACRIPEETLDAMTTDALVDAVLDFPFLMNLMVYNSASEGFDCLLSQCDALKELLTREDGADKLAEEYASLTTTLGSKSVIERKDTMSREALYPNLLEVILGQPEVYNEMTENNQYATEIAAKEFNDNKTSFLDVAIEENESQITRATTVKTPKGSTVEWIDYSGLPQMTADEKAYYNNWVQENYTIISVVRDPNVYYNCHSYAWYSTSSANKVWIPDPSIYMTDGSYTKKGSASATCKVFVKNDGTETSEIDGLILGDHSGIVNSVSGRTIVVTSKWGALGLYKHNVANSPYSGDHTTYTYWK